MSRELILLRHAHAENARPGQDDAERPLSERGVIEAKGAGRWLATHPRPTRILCSPATRTRETLKHALGEVAATFEPRIYEATAGELVSLIDESFGEDGNAIERLMLVGHNPGFETLVALLATGQSGDFRGIPPAGIAWIELDGTVEPGAGKLKAFWAP
jgi:phosphohistidine phosphatase SixA